ncbi:MAG: TonB family protein [Bacteroidota bacterium]
MKLTYHCMFDDHPPSEADLAQWQNFDQLLSQYHQAQQAKIKARRWWYGAIILTALILAGSTIFYFSQGLRPANSIDRITSLPPQLPDAENSMLPSAQIKPVPLPEKKVISTAKSRLPNPSPVEIKPSSQFEEARPAAGYPALYEYFAAELKYPEAARVEQAEGTVLVEFYIDEEGKPDQIQVLQGVREDINQEAIRLIQSMPRWLPAQVNGTPTATKHTMPLTFQLDDEF